MRYSCGSFVGGSNPTLLKINTFSGNTHSIFMKLIQSLSPAPAMNLYNQIPIIFDFDGNMQGAIISSEKP